MRAAVLILLLAIFGAPSARADEVTVAAAADLKFAMQELAAQFEKQTGHKVNVTFGSSGSLFSQIQNGAPFDLFFSADLDYARKLEAAGLSEPGTLVVYGIGRVVIWAPKNSEVEVSRGWSALLDPSVQKLSIANPLHAPYGRAAVCALRHAGIYDQVEPKLVFGEDVSQAAQFVESGNAQAGILALSLVRSPALRDVGRWWVIPPDACPPIEQGAVVLRSSRRKASARAFLNFLREPGAQKLLEEDGFALPGNGATPSSSKTT
jgi:molybdate transport system substrate-binding protein